MSHKKEEHIPQAQLWIGSHEHMCEKTERFLQKHFCRHGRCGTCITCRQIRERQYHGAIWLYPEKRYTLEQIKIIFDTISFSLASDERLFFIVQKADNLTTACSNSLLKSVEEPPPGYHFIFLAERKDLILPTICSRCTTITYHNKNLKHEKEELLTFFTKHEQVNPLKFTQTLDKIYPTETESVELIDKLLIYWMNQAKKAAEQKDNTTFQKSTNIINLLKQSLLKPPMPGSTKIFWKNLFMQLKN